MELSSLLTNEHSPTRKQSEHSHRVRSHGGPRAPQNPVSPNNIPKKVAFELLLDEGSKTRARIPLRVLINPHDTIDSIVTTVKNFYGIYEGHGISFEDDKGNTLIVRHENFVDDMTVYVRTVVGPQAIFHAYQALPGPDMHGRASLGEPFQMLPPQSADHGHGHSPSRLTSRLARKRSTSPQFGRGRRSVSQQKAGSMSNTASRGSSAHGSYQDDGDSDGGQSSITGSRKARSEQFASAEISMENVLKDGRRTGPMFESSELPLFVPPQIPITTSISSISPQRRTLPQDGPSPFARPAQKLYPYNPQLLPSPQDVVSEQSYNLAGQYPSPYTAPSVPQHGHRLRDRSQTQIDTQGRPTRAGYNGQAILPTPDPTVASCISDEDVARQLIALGDASNFSHGRTSASTLDDAFSGVADAASSTGATSDSDDYSEDDVELPSHKRGREHHVGDTDYDHEALIKSEYDDYDGEPRTKKIKTKAFDGSTSRRIPKSSSSRSSKTGKRRANPLPNPSKTSTNTGLMKAPTAPVGSPAQPRKTSSSSIINFQHQLGIDEEDLSSKPRCQRCRKSKKGCDRQRPCQRCKDAGIGVDGCVSEDEGNGRKGRFGRHMGVSVKKDGLPGDDDYQSGDMLSVEGSPDKNKKRKR